MSINIDKDYSQIHPSYSSDARSIGDDLIKQLKEMPTGKENGIRFQKLCVNILDFALSDCFSTLNIQEERWDYLGTQRTDLKFTNDYKNTRANSFWHQMCSGFQAKSIFIECKNSSKSIGNPAIRQAICYDDHSAGKFRIIISRKGLDRKGWDKIYSKYIGYFQLVILVLSQGDLIDLINARMDGEEPEKVFSGIRDILFNREYATKGFTQSS